MCIHRYITLWSWYIFQFSSLIGLMIDFRRCYPISYMNVVLNFVLFASARLILQLLPESFETFCYISSCYIPGSMSLLLCDLYQRGWLSRVADTEFILFIERISTKNIWYFFTRTVLMHFITNMSMDSWSNCSLIPTIKIAFIYQ